MIVTALPIAIRDATEHDIPFVFSSWLKTYERDRPGGKRLRSTLYFAGQHRLIERALRTCAVRVACNPDDEAQVYGWACVLVSDPPVLHYVCVKKAFQRMGVARALLEAFADVPLLYSHETAICAALPIPATWQYQPYAAFEIEASR